MGKKSDRTDNAPSSVKTSYKTIFSWGCILFVTAATMFTLGIFVGRGTAPITFDIGTLERQLNIVREKEELENAIYSDLDEQTPLIPEFKFYEELKNDDDISIGIIEKKSLKLSSKREIEKQSDEKLSTPINQRDNNKKQKKQIVDATIKKNIPVKSVVKDIKRKKDVKRKRKKDAIKKNAIKKDNIKKNVKDISDKKKIKKVDTNVSDRIKSNKYTIQVAALNNFSDSFNLVNTLKNKGFPAYIVIKKQGKITWYRIRVGSFNTKSEATVIEKRLKTKKYNTIILKKK